MHCRCGTPEDRRRATAPLRLAPPFQSIQSYHLKGETAIAEISLERSVTKEVSKQTRRDMKIFKPQEILSNSEAG